MMSTLRPSALVPSGFHVESAACDGATTVFTVHPISVTSRCPDCSGVSGRVRRASCSSSSMQSSGTKSHGPTKPLDREDSR